MYSICQICGRSYAGANCLSCTYQAIKIRGFGAETLDANAKPGLNVMSRSPMNDETASLKLKNGATFAVPKPICRIGQDVTNDIIIAEDDGVARFHAQICFDEEEEEFILKDLGTRSGTFLNSNQVHLDQVVCDGDQVTIGNYTFVFHEAKLNNS